MFVFLKSTFWMQLFSQFLDLFERFSDESFWRSILGDRLLTLLTRYLINDTLHIYMFVTFLPAVLIGATQGSMYIMERFEELLYVRVTVSEYDMIYTPINEYITKHFKGVERLRRVRGKTGYINPPDKGHSHDYLFFERPRVGSDVTPIIDLIPEKYHVFKIWYKGYKIFVNRSEEPISGRLAMNSSQFGYSSPLTTETIEIVMCSRNLQKLRSFIQEWINEYYDIRKNKLVIYKCNFQNHGWDDSSYWKEHSYKRKRLFSSVVLKKGDQELILNDILTFKGSKKWYDDRGIPFRRGILLYGPPGTGKTSFIQSLAGQINMNVAILNLSAAADDDSLSNVLARVPKNSLLVIEDIDHYKFEEGPSEKEKNEGRPEAKRSVSVSGILNAIDGIASLEESIIFMTCNDINNIPPALIRPGRVDIKLKLSYVDDHQAQLMFWRFFCTDIKETPLEEIPIEKYPLIEKSATTILSGIRVHAKAMEQTSGIQIDVSPAELINFFLYHSLKFNLPRNPDAVEECFKSLQENIPEFIKSITTDRMQAIEHAKKKYGILTSQNSEPSDPMLITPPASPTDRER